MGQKRPGRSTPSVNGDATRWPGPGSAWEQKPVPGLESGDIRAWCVQEGAENIEE